MSESPHATKWNERLGCEIDVLVLPAVLAMNDIPGIETLIIGEGGIYGHIAFRVEGTWSDLCDFCFRDLRELFSEYLDDEIRVDIFAKTEPYAWINFRHEALELVTGRLRANSRLAVDIILQEALERAAAPSLHKEGAGGEPPVVCNVCHALLEIADGEHVCGLTAVEAYSLGWRRGNNAAVSPPLPLQRTLPDEQFKGVVVEQSWAERARDKAHAIVRMWLEDESGTSQEQRDRLVEDISDAILAAFTSAGRAEPEQDA